MPGAGSGSACARQAAVNESAGDERLVTVAVIVAVVVVVAIVGMVVAGMSVWFPGLAS
jgi:F0F1-type ATP synthase membrane subunit c/vacuolar-type H+-ATPase subunit K